MGLKFQRMRPTCKDLPFVFVHSVQFKRQVHIWGYFSFKPEKNCFWLNVFLFSKHADFACPAFISSAPKGRSWISPGEPSLGFTLSPCESGGVPLWLQECCRESQVLPDTVGALERPCDPTSPGHNDWLCLATWPMFYQSQRIKGPSVYRSLRSFQGSMFGFILLQEVLRGHLAEERCYFFFLKALPLPLKDTPNGLCRTISGAHTPHPIISPPLPLRLRTPWLVKSSGW